MIKMNIFLCELTNKYELKTLVVPSQSHKASFKSRKYISLCRKS